MSEENRRVLRLACEIDRHLVEMAQPRVKVVEWPWVETQLAAGLTIEQVATELCGYRIREHLLD